MDVALYTKVDGVQTMKQEITFEQTLILFHTAKELHGLFCPDTS